MARSKFINEKEVEEYLCTNIESFCSEILKDKYICHSKQLNIGNRTYRKYGAKRVDVYIECENFNYIVEVKHPNNKCEMISAIGQILNYGRIKTDSKKETKLIVLTTMYDSDFYETIEHYNLPIILMEISKERLVVYK